MDSPNGSPNKDTAEPSAWAGSIFLLSVLSPGAAGGPRVTGGGGRFVFGRKLRMPELDLTGSSVTRGVVPACFPSAIDLSISSYWFGSITSTSAWPTTACSADSSDDVSSITGTTSSISSLMTVGMTRAIGVVVSGYCSVVVVVVLLGTFVGRFFFRFGRVVVGRLAVRLAVLRYWFLILAKDENGGSLLETSGWMPSLDASVSNMSDRFCRCVVPFGRLLFRSSRSGVSGWRGSAVVPSGCTFTTTRACSVSLKTFLVGGFSAVVRRVPFTNSHFVMGNSSGSVLVAGRFGALLAGATAVVSSTELSSELGGIVSVVLVISRSSASRSISSLELYVVVGRVVVEGCSVPSSSCSVDHPPAVVTIAGLGVVVIAACSASSGLLPSVELSSDGWLSSPELPLIGVWRVVALSPTFSVVVVTDGAASSSGGPDWSGFLAITPSPRCSNRWSSSVRLSSCSVASTAVGVRYLKSGITSSWILSTGSGYGRTSATPSGSMPSVDEPKLGTGAEVNRFTSSFGMLSGSTVPIRRRSGASSPGMLSLRMA
uniref:Uncharacterized protein n=1 Tax=Anopheles merus TaxID=30066 RepID=A0A182URD9_ANOME